MNKPTHPQVGTKYRVIEADSDDKYHHIFIGDIVELKDDDDEDNCPLFKKGNDDVFLLWSQLEPLEKTFETLEVGDVVITRHGSEKMVLDRTTHLIALSITDNFEAHDDWFTKQEFEEKYELTIKQEPTEVKELTLDQIAEKFNLPVEQIRIKKEE